jgi:uncharacterized membrane protein
MAEEDQEPEPEDDSADAQLLEGVAVPDEIRRILSQPGISRQLISFTAAAFASSWQGPLPPPEQLKGYEAALPGAADRILTMAEEQARHRHHLEKVAIEGGNSRSWWGLALGFAISLVVMGLGAGAVYTGHDAAGASIMTVDVAGLAGIFVYGRRQQTQERTAKDAASKQPPPAFPELPPSQSN